MSTSIKTFNFALEMDGIDQALIQEVKKPVTEVGAVKRAAGNHDIKEAGGVDVSDAELKAVKFADGGTDEFWNWLMTAQNPNTNEGGLSEEYKRDVIFKEKSPRNKTVTIWLWEGAWVRKVDDGDAKAGNQNENLIRSITLSVDRVKKIG